MGKTLSLKPLAAENFKPKELKHVQLMENKKPTLFEPKLFEKRTKSC